MTARKCVLAMAQKRGILTAADVARAGIHSQELTRLVSEGLLERVARGRYRRVQRAISEHHGLVVVVATAPNCVICLLSALSFHGVGTQLPSEVWLAIERDKRAPALKFPPTRVVRFSGAAFREGIEHHRIEGQSIRVYTVAKTIADLFKHRNKIGLDVAIEALRDGWQQQRFTMDALDRAARVCRVERVMRPYIESITA